MVAEGYRVFGFDGAVSRWAAEALDVARTIASDPAMRRANLRHGETWFVGVDALPNAPDGSIGQVPLDGPWNEHVDPRGSWHPAQLSIIYPGYPKQDPDESEAKHRYRIRRHAAHVDGLLPEGPARRRFLREPHAFILGIPLNRVQPSPLMVWPGSHQIMGPAFREIFGNKAPGQVDLTDGYQAARKMVFDRIEPVAVRAAPGQSVLLHRHLLHGVAPWSEEADACS